MKDKVKTTSHYGQLRTPMIQSELYGNPNKLPPIGANTNIPGSAPKSAPVRSPLNAGTGYFNPKNGKK